MLDDWPGVAPNTGAFVANTSPGAAAVEDFLAACPSLESALRFVVEGDPNRLVGAAWTGATELRADGTAGLKANRPLEAGAVTAA